MPSREIVHGTIHQRWQIDVTASGSHLDLSLDGKGGKDRSALSLNKTLQNDVIEGRIMLERANIHVSEDDIELIRCSRPGSSRRWRRGPIESMNTSQHRR